MFIDNSNYISRIKHQRRKGDVWESPFVTTLRIHVWYICLHLVEFYGKCRQIYHTWILRARNTLEGNQQWYRLVAFPWDTMATRLAFTKVVEGRLRLSKRDLLYNGASTKRSPLGCPRKLVWYSLLISGYIGVITHWSQPFTNFLEKCVSCYSTKWSPGYIMWQF